MKGYEEKKTSLISCWEAINSNNHSALTSATTSVSASASAPPGSLSPISPSPPRGLHDKHLPPAMSPATGPLGPPELPSSRQHTLALPPLEVLYETACLWSATAFSIQTDNDDCDNDTPNDRHSHSYNYSHGHNHSDHLHAVDLRVMAALVRRLAVVFATARPVDVYIVTVDGGCTRIFEGSRANHISQNTTKVLLFLAQDCTRPRHGNGIWRLYRWVRILPHEPGSGSSSSSDAIVLDEFDPVRGLNLPTATGFAVGKAVEAITNSPGLRPDAGAADSNIPKGESKSERESERRPLCVSSRPCPCPQTTRPYDSALYCLYLVRHIYTYTPRDYNQLDTVPEHPRLNAGLAYCLLADELLTNSRLPYLDFAPLGISPPPPTTTMASTKTTPDPVTSFAWGMRKLHQRHRQVLGYALRMDWEIRRAAQTPGMADQGQEGRRGGGALSRVQGQDMQQQPQQLRHGGEETQYAEQEEGRSLVQAAYSEAVALLVLFRWASTTKFCTVVVDATG